MLSRQSTAGTLAGLHRELTGIRSTTGLRSEVLSLRLVVNELIPEWCVFAEFLLPGRRHFGTYLLNLYPFGDFFGVSGARNAMSKPPPIHAWVFLGLLPLWVVGAAIAGEGPYLAKVTSDQVLVRSGAGSNYYPTGYLDADAEVEVYDVTPDGWIAIRPPEGAFSLVRVTSVIKEDGEEVALIKEDETPSYIGSQINGQHHVVHVKLNEEEPVRVLGLLELRDGETGKKKAWYKISPPAGEFRWIHEQFVERTDLPPIELATAELDKESEIALTAGEEPVKLPGKPKIEEPSWRKRTNPDGTPRVASLAPPLHGEKTPLATSSSMDQQEALEASLFEELGRLNVDPLVLIEVKLTHEVVKPVEHWELAPLQSSVREFVQTGETPLERGKARLLSEKIENFARLQERKLAFAEAMAAVKSSQPEGGDLSQSAEGTSSDDSSVASAAMGNSVETESLGDESKSTATSDDDELEPRYDGKGWLMPVVTRTAQARKNERYTPPFALTDQAGNVIQFVSPTPGLNLRRFTRQEVGIYGQVSPIDQYTKPHLTAHRVVVLSRHR